MSDSLERRSKVIYRNPLNDIPDQWLFFGFFITGAFLIVLLKSIDARQLIVTMFPVALMLMYAFLGFATQRYRIREDRLGDNLYYLGFLYTLVSLAYALWAYQSDGSAIDTIITNFGIAIATTILGLAFRVFFAQMREDPVEYEREARFELADASRRMKSSLDDITIEMSSFKRKLSQTIAEGITDIADKANSSLEKNVTDFANTNQQVIEKIQDTFNSFTDHSTQLSQVTSQNVTALQALFERIEKIEASPDLLAAKLDPVMAKFAEVAEESTKRTKVHATELKKLRQLVDASLEAATALELMTSSSKTKVEDQIQGFARALDEGIAAANRLSQGLDESAQGIKAELEANNSALESNRVALASLRQIMDSEADQSKAASANIRQLVVTDGELNRTALDELRSSVAATIAANRVIVAEAAKAFSEDTVAIRQNRDEMNAMLNDSRGAMADLQKALVSLTQTIIGKIDGR